MEQLLSKFEYLRETGENIEKCDELINLTLDARHLKKKNIRQLKNIFKRLSILKDKFENDYKEIGKAEF